MTTTKIIEMIGESQVSWTDAVENAVAEACESIDGITGVDILNLTGAVQNGKIVEFKANVQVAFPVYERRINNSQVYGRRSRDL